MAFDTSANIGIRIFVDDAASRVLFGINQQLGQVAMFSKQAGRGFADMSQGMAGLGMVAGLGASFVLFGGAIALAVKNAIEFQSLLIKIQRATNATTAEMQALGQVLMTIGGHSIFSLQQLADGFVLLGQRGVSAKDIIATVGNQMNILAESTGSTPVQAAGLLASTLAAFNIKATDSARVVDLLQFAFEHGLPSISQMTSALARVGSVADTLGIPLDQIIPSLDVLSRAMGNGNTAATSLYYFLSRLAAPTASQAKEMQKLGLNVFDANGRFIGILPALEQLNTVLSKLTPKEREQALAQMFPLRGTQGLAILLQDLPKVIALTDQLKKSHDNMGTALLRARQQEDSAAGAWNSFKSNVQDILTLIGGPFLAVLQPMILHLRDLSTVIRQLVSGPAAQFVALFLTIASILSLAGLAVLFFMSPFGQLFGIMLLVVTAISAVSAGIAFLIAKWDAVTSVLNRARPILAAVAIGLLTLGGIIAAIVVTPFLVGMAQIAVLGTAIGLVMLTRAIPGLVMYGVQLAIAAAKAIAFAVVNAGTLIPQLLASAAAITLVGLRTAATATLMAVRAIPSILASAAAWTVAAAAELLALAPYILIGAAVVGAVVGLGLLIVKLGGLKVILDIARAAWAAILPAIQQAGAAIRGAFMQAVQQLQPLWVQLVAAFNQAKPILIFLGAVLGVLIVAAVAILIGVLRMLISVFANVVVTVIQVVARVVQVFTGLVQFFVGVFKLIFGIFTGNTKMMQQAWALMGQGITNIVHGLVGAVVAVFVGFFRTVLGGIQNFISGVINFFMGLWDRLVGHSIVPDMLSAIVRYFVGLPGRIIGSLVSLGGQLWNTFLNAGQRALSAIGQKGNDILSFMRGLPGKIVGALGNLGGLLWSAGVSLINGLWNGAKSVIGGLLGWFGDQLGKLRNMFPHSPVKEGPLRGYETWMPTMIKGMAESAQTASPSLIGSMSRVAGGIQSGILATSPGAAQAGGGQVQFIINLDGKKLYDSNMKYLRNDLQMQGAARHLR